MTAAAPPPVSINIDEDTKDRLKRLPDARDHTSH
jgi:predicted transcriptional regulator